MFQTPLDPLVALGAVPRRVDVPNTKLLIRLLETLEKTTGDLLAPWQIRRKGRAKLDLRRDQRLALAQAERDMEDIKYGRKHFTSDYRLVDGPTPKSATRPSDDDSSGTLATIAQQNMLVERMRAELNVVKALVSAAAELDGDVQEPPDRRVDDDWLLRWRESAGRVSSEKLQDLWGKVLAGEVKSPGAFSAPDARILEELVAKRSARDRKPSSIRRRRRLYSGRR